MEPSTAELRVRFSSSAHAELARACLAVDPELNTARVSRELAAEGDALVARFTAGDSRSLRLSLGAFFDMVGVLVRTLRDFADDAAGGNAADAADAADAATVQTHKS